MNRVTVVAAKGSRDRAISNLLTPDDVDAWYGIPASTQAVWRCTDRYGFRRLVIKVGRSVRYRRDEFEAWLESRRQVIDDTRESGARGVA